MDLRELIQILQQSTPSSVGVGNLSEAEANAVMQNPNFLDSVRQLRQNNLPANLGQLSEAEAARLQQLMMQQKVDEFSRQNAFMSNPQAAQYYQQTNPLGNTMTNVAPQGGGMAVRQPPMDLSSLIRMLTR